jgi:hypothetical protein
MNILLKALPLVFFMLINNSVCNSQVITVNTVKMPNTSGDSSIYDIIKISSDKYLMTGKQGYMEYIDSNTILHSFSHQVINSSLLKAEYLGNNKTLVGGTGGTLILIDESKNTLTIKQIPHFSYACFYDILMLNDSCILLAGGNKGIAEAKKKLPRGFIIATTDFGETWEYIYRNPCRMVWDIDKDSRNNIFASTYSPINTKILKFSEFKKNTLIKCKSLFHSIDINSNDTSLLAVGSESHSDRKTASVLRINNQKLSYIEKLKSTGIFWDIKPVGKYYLACGSSGMLYVIGEKGEVTPFDTKVKENLYCLIEINSNSFYAVGSNQTILKVDISAKE